MLGESNFAPSAVVPPRGTHQTKCDEKGRLKLPTVFQEYLKALGETRVFITSLDEATGRAYPISVWSANEKFFEEESDDPDAAADVALLANYYGDDSEIDSQGRILVPTNLRRHLEIENQVVWLDCFRGHINIYSDRVYQARLVRARGNADQKVKMLEKRGMR